MSDYLIQGETLTAIADAIRSKTGKTDAILVPDMPAEIAGITADGGSSADVCYVTFVSHDGAVEYGKKAVAVGDDCADPIARGLFETPVRESTVQYDYTFAGWATEPNGGLDNSALKTVTEDRTVYANYIAAVRYYTISYYDGDTLLKSESLAYGAMPAYIPEKNGFNFEGWEPESAAVSGDASYFAQWSEALTFAGASWADIAAVSEAGEASKFFAVGDTKEVVLTDTDGNTETITVAIAGFDHDDLADGSGKAGISIVCISVPTYTTPWYSTYAANNSYPYYYSGTNTFSCHTSDVWTRLQKTGAIWNRLPTALQNVIKPVMKEYDDSVGVDASIKTISQDLFPLSITELGNTLSKNTYYLSVLGSRYELFPKSDSAPTVTTGNDPETTVSYWTRNMYRHSNTDGRGGVYCSGTTYGQDTGAAITTLRYLRFGFCV